MSNNKKAKAWEELTVMFNRFPGVSKRGVKQLINYHKNMKRNKNKLKRKLEISKTEKDPKECAASNPAVEMSNKKTPLVNCYDSDDSSYKNTADTAHGESNCNQEKSHEIIEVQYACADFTECEFDEESSDDDILISPSNLEMNHTSFQSQAPQTVPGPFIKRESNAFHDTSASTNKKIYKLNGIKNHLSADALIQQRQLKSRIFNQQHKLERDKFYLEKEKFAMEQEKQDLKLRLMNEQIKMYELINERIEKGEGVQICININK